jgi:hypothetical protein
MTAILLYIVPASLIITTVIVAVRTIVFQRSIRSIGRERL